MGVIGLLNYEQSFFVLQQPFNHIKHHATAETSYNAITTVLEGVSNLTIHTNDEGILPQSY